MSQTPISTSLRSLVAERFYHRCSYYFRWDADGLLIIGLTPSGRATVQALNMNDRERVNSRRLWVSVGWHPPT